MSLAKLLKPRVCELGKIKIGGLGDERTSQKGGTYRMPVKYDHFVITTLHRGADGRLVGDERLMASLKEHADADGKIRNLPVSLLSNDIEEVLQARYQWFDGKRLAAASDGETLVKHADFKTGEWLPKPETLPWKPEFAQLRDGKGNPRFKLHCTMNVVIASSEARWGGYYKFRTTSAITSEQLYGSLVQLRQLTGGVLRGLPLRLVVRPMQVCPPPERKPTTVYVVHVELAGSDLTAIQAKALELARFEVQHAKQLAAAQAEYKQLLRAPDDFLDDDDEAEVAQEFAPHQQPGVLPAQQPEPERHDPKAALADQYARRVEEMKTSEELQALVGHMNTDAKAGLLDKAGIETLAPLVSARKEQLAAPPAQQPETFPLTGDDEGERGADPAPAPAATDPAPKPAPAAERRTAGPALPKQDDDIPRAGPAIVTRLLELMHALGVNWAQVRDGSDPKGKDVAEGAALPKLPAGARVTELTAPEALRLKAELEKRVAKKQEAAAKRAATKGEREKELAAEENAGSAS